MTTHTIDYAELYDAVAAYCTSKCIHPARLNRNNLLELASIAHVPAYDLAMTYGLGANNITVGDCAWLQGKDIN